MIGYLKVNKDFFEQKIIPVDDKYFEQIKSLNLDLAHNYQGRHRKVLPNERNWPQQVKYISRLIEGKQLSNRNALLGNSDRQSDVYGHFTLKTPVLVRQTIRQNNRPAQRTNQQTDMRVYWEVSLSIRTELYWEQLGSNKSEVCLGVVFKNG